MNNDFGRRCKYLMIAIIMLLSTFFPLIDSIGNSSSRNTGQDISYPVGLVENSNGTEWYYYDVDMSDWEYFNEPAFNYFVTYTDWQSIDGWGYVYLADYGDYYWFYYDINASILYHYNRENGAWYYFDYNFYTWIFYAMDDYSRWKYDSGRSAWIYLSEAPSTTETVTYGKPYSVGFYNLPQIYEEWYYYNENMNFWVFYSKPLLDYFNTYTDWKAVDGWGSAYIYEYNDWYWYYHDKATGVLYHYDFDNGSWYTYNSQYEAWYFHSVDDISLWYYDTPSETWYYYGEGYDWGDNYDDYYDDDYNYITLDFGYYEGEMIEDWYFFDEDVYSWVYYNPYVVDYIKRYTDWKRVDGWNSMYLAEPEIWYWFYYDRSARIMYHFDYDTDTWYYYDRLTEMFHYDSMEYPDNWFLDKDNKQWIYYYPMDDYDDWGWDFDDWDDDVWNDFKEDTDWDYGTWQNTSGITSIGSSTATIDVTQTNVTTTGNLKEHTLMIYLNGSDLETYGSFATRDIREMMVHGSNENVNIVLLTGGTKQWQSQNISSTQTQYWYVTKDGLRHLQDVGSASTRSIGDPKTLSDFITFAYANYPANKYSFIFWNHGAGAVDGFGHDEHTYDNLLLNEIYEGLYTAKAATGMTFDLIGFDACLMATLETAYVVKDFARYMVASEELEPGHGWDYTALVGALHENPRISGDGFGKKIIDSYLKYCQANLTSYDVTLSLIDLSRVENVVSALNNFVQDLRGADGQFGSNNNFSNLVKARTRAESYGGDYITDMVDLWDLANKMRDAGFNYDRATAVMNEVERAVVYKIGSLRNPISKGISIYYPSLDTNNFTYNWNIYRDLYFSPEYKEFIGVYLSRLMSNRSNRSTTAFSNAPIVEMGADNIKIEFNKDELARIVDLRLEFGIKREGINLWLGVERVNIDSDTGYATSKFVDEWYTIKGNLVSARVERTQAADYLNVEVLYNGRNAWLVYTLKQNGSAELNHVKIVNTDKTSRPIYETVKVGDTITLSYGESTGITINVNSLSDLSVLRLPLSAGEYCYRFVSYDLLNLPTYSEISYNQRGNSTSRTLADVGFTASFIRERDSDKSDKEDDVIVISKSKLILIVVISLLAMAAIATTTLILVKKKKSKDKES